MLLTLILSLIIFITLILSIILFPKIKLGKISVSTYWIVSLLGALLLIVLSCVSFNDVFSKLFDEYEINPIKILCLFFSMSFISIFLEKAGFFEFLASFAAKRANKNQLVLFVVLYFLTALLTVFTSNDIVILTFTPFICYFAKNAKINPIPFLVGEFAAANTWSMMLIIGNPTNIYLGLSQGIDFISYFKVMSLPTLCAGIVEFSVILLVFSKQLSKPMEVDTKIIPVKDKIDVIVGLIHLFVCLVLLAISNVTNWPMWLITSVLALLLFAYCFIRGLFNKNFINKSVPIFKSLPYELIPFFISMVVIVVALNQNGISELLRNFLGGSHSIWAYGSSSYLFANLINNIPMSILYSSLPNMGGVEQTRAVFASIAGSNIGAFLTPIGALAGIMFTSLIKEHDIKFSFKEFTLYGLIISLPTFFVTLLVLSFVL